MRKMNEKAIVKSVAHMVAGILSSKAPMLASFAEPISTAVISVGCRNQILLAKAIEAVGPELVQYSGEIANRLVECAEIVEVSKCRREEFIIQAIMDDSAATIAEKVELVNRYNQARVDGIVSKIQATGRAAATVIITASMLGMKDWVPKVTESLADINKERERTKRTRERADAVREIFDSFTNSHREGKGEKPSK